MGIEYVMEFTLTVNDPVEKPKEGDKVPIHYKGQVIESTVKQVSPSGEVTLIGSINQ
jgi:hypothetical protein